MLLFPVGLWFKIETDLEIADLLDLGTPWQSANHPSSRRKRVALHLVLMCPVIFLGITKYAFWIRDVSVFESEFSYAILAKTRHVVVNRFGILNVPSSHDAGGSYFQSFRRLEKVIQHRSGVAHQSPAPLVVMMVPRIAKVGKPCVREPLSEFSR